jgi:hypothetical protein
MKKNQGGKKFHAGMPLRAGAWTERYGMYLSMHRIEKCINLAGFLAPDSVPLNNYGKTEAGCRSP